MSRRGARGLVLRLAFGLVYWTDKPLTHDEREYLSLADSLARGRGFTFRRDHSATREPSPRSGGRRDIPLFSRSSG